MVQIQSTELHRLRIIDLLEIIFRNELSYQTLHFDKEQTELGRFSITAWYFIAGGVKIEPSIIDGRLSMRPMILSAENLQHIDSVN